MPVGQIFHVLTEFRFEIGGALASTSNLKGAVDGLSSSADQALISFQKLSLGIVSGFVSGPGGGVLGILGTAVKNAEDFKQSQIALANVLGAGSGTFADRMSFARQEMERISRLAVGIGISGKDLVNFTKTVTPAIAPKVGGLNAVKQSAELGRVFLKGAPSLGISQEFGIDQLRRLVLGLETAGNQVFEVLVQDSKAMREFAGNAKKFKDLSVDEKMKKLTAAFQEFAGGEAVAAFTNSITGQIGRLKEQLIGVGSVLRPLGEAIIPLVIDTLKQLNDFIDKSVRPAIKNVAFALEPFVKNMDMFLATLFQFKALAGDLSAAITTLLRVGLVLGIGSILNFLGIQIPVVTTALNAFSASIAFLERNLIGGALGRFLTGPLTGILGIFNQLFILVTRFLAPLGLLVLVFQVLSRAVAIFRIESAKKIAGLVEKISELFSVFARIFALFNEGIDVIARFLAASPAFDFLFGLAESFIDFALLIGKGIALAIASFQGFVFAILELVEIIKDAIPGLTGDFAFGGDLSKAFEAGTNDIFEKVFGKIEAGGAIQNNVINQDIKMNNSFKESLEPDRIAFTIRDQLFKAALNPKEATAGAGIQGSFRSTR